MERSTDLAECRSCSAVFRTVYDPTVLDAEYSRRLRMPWGFSSWLLTRHHYDFLIREAGLGKRRNVLEIGPGDGKLLRLIRSRHPGVGLSCVEPGADHCRSLMDIPGLVIHHGYLESAAFEGKFDLIILSHVLEHIADPLAMLKTIRRTHIGEGGVIYIDVPNRECEIGTPRRSACVTRQHLFFFDATSLTRLLAQAGFATPRGEKYRTLPPRFMERSERISCDVFAWRRTTLKIVNRLSLELHALTRLARGSVHSVPLGLADPTCNNLAIVSEPTSFKADVT